MKKNIYSYSTSKNFSNSFQIVILFVLALVLINSNINACDKEWTGAVSTNWTDPGNWSPTGVPDSTQSVKITYLSSHVYPIIASGNYKIKDLRMFPGGCLTFNGDLFEVTNEIRVINDASVLLNNGFINTDRVFVDITGNFIVKGGVLDINSRLYGLGSIDHRGGVIWLEGAPLPVELTSFTASVDGSAVTLNWETATEVNNYGFDIERSSDMGKSWNKIGFVDGYGNSNSAKYYSFSDNINSNGTYFYRLLQIDTDGQSEYSDYIELVGTGIAEEFELAQNYPNPFNPTTKISYSLPSSSEVSVKVYDMLGNEVRTLVNEMKTAGTHEVNFDASNLSSGIYIYSIQAGEFTKTMKMTLVK